MSEASEVAPARRNLLIIASVLLIIEVTGATVKSINAPGVTIDIKRPELIIYFLYSILFYSIFRFWQLAKPHYNSLSHAANPFINQHPVIKTLVQENSFGLEGVNYTEQNPVVRRHLFKREIIFSGYSEGKGIKKGPVRLPYLKIFLAEIIADFKAIPTKKDFVEYSFPTIYSFFVLSIKAFVLLLGVMSGQ